VPNAPPLTTNAPDEPVLTARADATPVPKPLTSLAIRTVSVLLAPLIVLLVSVSEPACVDNVPLVGKVTLLAAVVVNVRAKAPFVASVLPLANVSVALVAGAVNATLLMLVALATPNVGVVSDGLVANTSAPLPVSSVTAPARLALDGVAKNVATPVPSPVIEPTAGVIAILLALVTRP